MSAAKTPPLAKIQLLNKKVQDRKTAEIFENVSFDYVTDILELSESQDTTIGEAEESAAVVPVTILATMKSLPHTIQSKARWEKFEKERGGDGAVYTLSSKGDFTNWRDVVLAMSRHTRPARHITLCTLKLRIENLIEIARNMEDLNKGLLLKRILRCYLDEIDKYIDTLRPLIEELAQFECVGKIVLVTATPEKLWSKSHPGWDRLYILNPRINHDDGSYLMFKDCHHIDADEYMSGAVPPRTWTDTSVDRYRRLIDYHHRLVMRYPDLMTPGRVIFAPGLEARESHELVARFWTHMGCSVFVLNGERTSAGFYGRLYLCDGSVVDVQHSTYDMLTTPQFRAYAEGQGLPPKSQAQLNDVLANLYWEHNLNATPLVMTGLLCVERAQSLVHPVWGTFTDGIYYSARNADDAYQQQRQLGHIKKWDTYRGVPRVFAPERYRQDVLVLEQRAHLFAERHGGSTASVSDFISAGGGVLTSHERRRVEKDEKELARKYTEMTIQEEKKATLKEAVSFLEEKLGRGVRVGGSKRSAFHEIGGYLVSTRLLSYYKKKTAAELVAEDRLTLEKFKRISRGMNISHNKGQRYMIYPVYPTMMSTPEEVEYYVRYIPSAESGTITHV